MGENLNMKEFLLQIQSFFTPEIFSGITAFAGILFAGLIFRFLLIGLASRIFKRMDKKSNQDLFKTYLNPVLKPAGNFALLFTLYLLLNFHPFFTHGPHTETYQTYGYRILKILLALNFAWLCYALINLICLYLEKKAAKTESRLDDQLVPIFKKFFRALVVIFAFLMIFQTLGYSVSGIVAGLGIGGFALAFASKDALANIFGSIIIFTDRPFQVGDSVRISGNEGTVEEVGLRSTKIRTQEKTLITIPNSSIANTVVENTSARNLRRVNFSLGLKYSTPAEKIKNTVEAIREILKNHPEVDQDYWFVNFHEFGASSLNLWIYYYTATTVLTQNLEIKQQINFKIMEALEKMKVELAFPSTSVYLENLPPDGRETKPRL